MGQYLVFMGKHRVDSLGASSIIAQNLTFYPSDGEICHLISAGILSDSSGFSHIIHHNIDDVLLRRLLPSRVVGRFARTFLPNTNLRAKARVFLESHTDGIADRVGAAKLTRLLQQYSMFNVAIGLNAYSTEFGHIAKNAGIPFVIHSQWCHPSMQHHLVADAHRQLGFEFPPFSARRAIRQTEELRSADLVWCPSEMARESLIKNGVDSKKTIALHYGINVERFLLPVDAHSPDDPFLVLFVGNVCIQKGIHVLLDGMVQSHVKNAKLILNGGIDEPARIILEKYKTRLCAMNIRVKIDPGDPRRYLKKASLLVLPSVHDSFGIVVLEAMAAGLPVVVSTGVGAKECVRHGKNGFVFNSGQSEELASYLDILFNNPDVRIEFGRVSRDLSLDHDLSKSSARIIAAILKKSYK